MEFKHDFLDLRAEAYGIFGDWKVFIEGAEKILDTILVASAADDLE